MYIEKIKTPADLKGMDIGNHPKYADLLIAKKTRKCLLASFFVIIRK